MVMVFKVMMSAIGVASNTEVNGRHDFKSEMWEDDVFGDGGAA